MQSDQYIEGAILTESGRFDAQNVDADTLKTVFKLVVAAGQAMDALKRALYYGKPLNKQKLEEAMTLAKSATHDYDFPVPLTLQGYSDTPAVHPRTVHAALGLVTESAEIVEKVLKSFEDGSPFDYANLFEELGDGQWYTALAIHTAASEDPASGPNALKTAIEESTRDEKVYWLEVNEKLKNTRMWNYEAIWKKNLDKLKARYPNKFETEKAFNRDISNEKQALGE